MAHPFLYNSKQEMSVFQALFHLQRVGGGYVFRAVSFWAYVFMWFSRVAASTSENKRLTNSSLIFLKGCKHSGYEVAKEPRNPTPFAK